MYTFKLHKHRSLHFWASAKHKANKTENHRFLRFSFNLHLLTFCQSKKNKLHKCYFLIGSSRAKGWNLRLPTQRLSVHMTRLKIDCLGSQNGLGVNEVTSYFVDRSIMSLIDQANYDMTSPILHKMKNICWLRSSRADRCKVKHRVILKKQTKK